jgi:NTP pyrophosphatase (non-canonical NTP hydrolase)
MNAFKENDLKVKDKTLSTANPDGFVLSELTNLAKEINKENHNKGFWDTEDKFYSAFNPADSFDLSLDKALMVQKLALIVSEISEGIEGLRKDAQDDHLPQYDSLSVELADTLIRILDFCGYYGINIGKITKEKLLFNRSRPHKHGKEF